MYQSICSEFYDIDKPAMLAEEVELYTQHFSKEQLLLQPMCGSGKLLIPMLKAGFNIHGLDNSLFMLACLEGKLKNENIHTELFESSVEKMNLAQQYDGIIIPYGSFQLLHPRANAYYALENFYNSLAIGGKLVIELFIPWKEMFEGAEEEHVQKETVLSDGKVIVRNSYNHSYKEEQYYHSKGTYIKSQNGIVIAREDENLYINWYYKYEFEMILNKFGFKNIQIINRLINNEEYKLYIAEK